MKKGILAVMFTASLALVSCQDATDKIGNNEDASSTTETTEAVAEGTAAFTFEEESWDFGDINEGDPAVHVFKFTNSGNVPLIISNAAGSCGCTVPTWPKEPIAPGAEGQIEVSFSSAGRPGMNKKTVTITANTVPNKKVLNIQTNVIAKPKADATAE